MWKNWKVACTQRRGSCGTSTRRQRTLANRTQSQSPAWAAAHPRSQHPTSMAIPTPVSRCVSSFYWYRKTQSYCKGPVYCGAYGAKCSRPWSCCLCAPQFLFIPCSAQELGGRQTDTTPERVKPFPQGPQRGQGWPTHRQRTRSLEEWGARAGGHGGCDGLSLWGAHRGPHGGCVPKRNFPSVVQAACAWARDPGRLGRAAHAAAHGRPMVPGDPAQGRGGLGVRQQPWTSKLWARSIRQAEALKLQEGLVALNLPSLQGEGGP